jgi:hypothetical protein
MDKKIEQEGINAYIETEFPLTIFKSWDVVLGFFSEVKSKTDKDSQEMYDKLPNEVMVYRGVLAKDGVKEKTGVSWTTDYKVAEMFALRFKPLGGTPYIMKGEINKEDILYFTNARQESEALINEDDMMWIDIDEVER